MFLEILGMTLIVIGLVGFLIGVGGILYREGEACSEPNTANLSLPGNSGLNSRVAAAD